VWWGFCANNFDIKGTFEDYIENKILILFFLFSGTGLIVYIDALLVLILKFKNETINFYIATLPIALGLSYATLRELKKKRRQQT
jgi:hypothetical protein